MAPKLESASLPNDADYIHPSPTTLVESTTTTAPSAHAAIPLLPLEQSAANGARSSRDKSSSTSSTASCSNANSSESSNESIGIFPSGPPADIYPSSLRESYVEELVGMRCDTESVEFWLVRQIIDILKGVCTMGGLRSALKRCCKEDFVERIGKYYRETGGFETDVQMVNFMDWCFLMKGVSLREVALYIVERPFFDHEATRFREAVTAGLKEVGQSEKGKGQESGRGGRDEDYGNADGGGGGSKMGIKDAVLSGGLRMHATTRKIVLDIDPIRVTIDQDCSQHNVNSKKVALVQNPPRKRIKRKRQNETDKLQELLLQTNLQYSQAITAQLPSDWQHNVDLNNKHRSTGLLYHATTKFNISTLKFGGIEPRRFLRSQLTTGEAFYVGNSLPECILNVFLKKPTLERIIPDPVAVLSFEMETRLLEHDAERKESVVLDLNDHSLHELQDIVMHNMTGRRENLYIEEGDKDGELTGAVVPVDLVIGPWLMPISLPGSDRIHTESLAYDGLEPLQFAFTSPESWDFLEGSNHAAFVVN